MLDVGCGTGKVARSLLDRGLDVLGVELDARMASMAREHGVEVEIAEFESWDDRGRTFDLITFGDAWHWIDPVPGWRKISRVLRPGGTVVRFWNHHEVDEPLKAIFAVREDHARDRARPDVVAPSPTTTHGSNTVPTRGCGPTPRTSGWR